MQLLHIKDVRVIVASEAFREWFHHYQGLRDELTATRERLFDLEMESLHINEEAERLSRRAEDLIFEAGDNEQEASAALARYMTIENDSFEYLSRFEQQRNHCRELWDRIGGQESELETRRQRLGEVIATFAAQGRSPVAYSEADGHRLATEVQAIQASLLQHQQELAREEAQRDQLWILVEERWSQGFKASMEQSEHTFKARRARRTAERLLTKASNINLETTMPPLPISPDEVQQEETALRQRETTLREQYRQHLAQGQEDFKAFIVDEFVYWPSAEDHTFFYCVPLIEEKEALNLQVSPLIIYQAKRAQGLTFVEPAVETEADSDQDARLEAFFSAKPGFFWQRRA